MFLPATPKNGTLLSLDCAAKGQPLPSITWFENTIQIKNQSNAIQITSQVAGGVLTSNLNILSVSYWNNGSFSCIASNKYGSVKHNAPVQVHGMLHFTNQSLYDSLGLSKLGWTGMNWAGLGIIFYFICSFQRCIEDSRSGV